MRHGNQKYHGPAIALAVLLVLHSAAGQEEGRVRPPPELTAGAVRTPLLAPNLQPNRVHFRAGASSTTVQVCVDVANLGNANSAPTAVQLAVVVSNPRTQGGVSSQTLRLALGVVQPGVWPTEICGGYTVPNRTADWDLHANAHVDPDDTVRESNEGDNLRWRDCRLWSPNPGSYRTAVDAC